jgi:hypothetical protein
MLVQQYLSMSPRLHHDLLSGGGALKRGHRMGSLLDEGAAAPALRISSTPVSMQANTSALLSLSRSCCTDTHHEFQSRSCLSAVLADLQ